MIETALNAAWMLLATGVFVAAPRCTPRVRVALVCAVALLFPIISISDDFCGDPAFNEAATIVVAAVMTTLLVAVAHIHSVAEPFYSVSFATPSDPRSPPR